MIRREVGTSLQINKMLTYPKSTGKFGILLMSPFVVQRQGHLRISVNCSCVRTSYSAKLAIMPEIMVARKIIKNRTRQTNSPISPAYLPSPMSMSSS
jgi:hypothetical protein